MRAGGAELSDLPEDGGVYALVMERRGGPVDVRVGALGVLTFAPGIYCYVGSARRGLAARVRRHLRRGGKGVHWHVDHVRAAMEPVAVLAWTGSGADECALSEAIGRRAEGSVPRFGSSDCRCRSHLHYFSADPMPGLRRLQVTDVGRGRVIWQAGGT
jgi:sugar fermentation stimulation protein A